MPENPHPADPDDPTEPAPPAGATRTFGLRQVVTFVVGLVIVVGIFAFAIPKFADYGAVWDAMKTLTPVEWLILVGLMVFNLYTYWLANQAAVPGIAIGQAAVLTQTPTSVANTLPAGGAIALGVTFAMLGSWGFTPAETTLYIGVTGIWNLFTKLGLPVVALAALVIAGRSDPRLVSLTAVGLLVLGVAVTLLIMVLRNERMARRVGDVIGSVLNAVLKPFRRSVTRMGERAVTFRAETIVLIRRRWIRLTATTISSQLALCAVLVASLRAMGVSEQELPAVEILSVFAFSRLLSAIPLTPGGAGVIDLGYIAGFTSLYPDERGAIVAGVLVFRMLTFGIQIPIGGLTYLIWRAKASWKRTTPPPGSIAGELQRGAPTPV